MRSTAAWIAAAGLLVERGIGERRLQSLLLVFERGDAIGQLRVFAFFLEGALLLALTRVVLGLGAWVLGRFEVPTAEPSVAASPRSRRRIPATLPSPSNAIVLVTTLSRNGGRG